MRQVSVKFRETYYNCFDEESTEIVNEGTAYIDVDYIDEDIEEVIEETLKLGGYLESSSKDNELVDLDFTWRKVW